MPVSLAHEYYAAQKVLEDVSRKGKRPVRGKLSSTDWIQMGGPLGSPHVMIRLKETGVTAKIPLAAFQAMCRWGNETGMDTLKIENVTNAQDRVM
jgi:hypothetical protein